MPRKTKSQWEFGELFEPASTRRVFTVSELTGQVRRLLEKEFGAVWVTGEVSNFRAQSSGHSYFTLKDGGSQLNCILFRGEAQESRKFLEDGQKVILQGDLTVYEPRGQYQLRVVAVELQGIGALQLAFEKLKQKLQAQGWFAPERKRPLPRYPQRIGLVTSPTGAAIRDVLHVIRRRQPGLEIILAPCRVQGEGAAAEIAAAIRLLNEWAVSSHTPLDLILVTRGGGSLEDLWAFNEEMVGRAIFESDVPVVSAVGHEIDFTISDFVADLRAATPSAAAEIITDGVYASRRFVAEAATRLQQRVRQRLALEKEGLAQLRGRLGRVHPRRVLQEKLQYLDDLQTALARSTRLGWRAKALAWSNLQQRWARTTPSAVVGRRRQTVSDLARLLEERARFTLAQARNRFSNLAARLTLLAPENVLARGYSITTDAETGRVLRAAAQVRPGQEIKTRLRRGKIQSVVNETGIESEPEP
jgi:exodeoxyribonuclease VII large subunit